jgi:eukaryotic-like serine/threonine-protein kinase
MMGENKEARDVFLAVLALNSAEEQNRYLAQACGNKPELRQRVEILLREHQRAGSFLEAPALFTSGPTVVLNARVTEKAGDRIGHYKLLEQIGEGRESSGEMN